MFRNLNVEFETVIIDEAAQCIELSALIPLKYGCSKCILVGDPEQLPPTVLSRSAQSFGYEQSLFVRMQQNHPNDVHLLDTQYRMHPEISSFPSQQFYNSRLLDGEGMAKLRQQPWHASSILGPYRFFHIDGVQSQQGHSLVNTAELNATLKLYARLKADYRNIDFKGKIGIITTYKGQLIAIQRAFESAYGEAINEDIEFNTTDAFQGREREIIIFSCVRARASGGIGFLSDIRRMNVGLTRAKSSLWVLGDSRALQQGEYWNKLIQDAKARDRFTGDDVMALLSRPTARDAPSGGYVQAISSRPVTTSSADIVQTLLDNLDAEDNDVEMIDAPSASSSRKSTPSNGNTDTLGRTGRSLGGNDGNNPLKNSATAAAALGISQNGKRPREPAKDDDMIDIKKVRVIFTLKLGL
jgi:senataxin